VSVNTSDPMIGRLVDGRYQVRNRIARGGMATVYLATDLRLERRVAIKIMHGHLADDSKFRERFIQEARSAARLAHPNVVNVFDQGQDTEMAYLVMEYLPGITLRDLLQERAILTTDQTFDILEAVLSGLGAAHKAGIVHRDLKPENVLLADDGRIKIGDFGLARAASANTATGAALLGTIAYLSPELVTRGIADTRSDIYAVGIMMYEMLAGEQPFRGEQPMQIAYQHANDSVPAPSLRNSRVPAELDELVLWATAREPDERPRDARALLDQLLDTRELLRTALPTAQTSVQRTMVMPAAGFVGSDAETQVIGGRVAAATGPVVSDATSSLTAVAEKRRKRGWWLFGAILLLVALAGGAAWWFGTGPGSRVTVPDSIVGQSVEAATAQLTELGLLVEPSTIQVFDPYVDSGLVAGTDPAVGSSLPRDAHVTVLVSKGPEPKPIPKFVGLSEDDANDVVDQAGFTLDADRRLEQFSADVPAGEIIAAFGLADDQSTEIALVEGETYYDKRPVWFSVSAGPLPDVTGLTFDAAVAKLAESDLIGTEGPRSFSDTVPADTAIGVQAQTADAPIFSGDTVLVILSKGVDLVPVPDVIGKSIREARDLLTAAEFVVIIKTNVPTAFYNSAEVQTVTPEGDSLKRGSTITIESYYEI